MPTFQTQLVWSMVQTSDLFVCLFSENFLRNFKVQLTLGDTDIICPRQLPDSSEGHGLLMG